MPRLVPTARLALALLLLAGCGGPAGSATPPETPASSPAPPIPAAPPAPAASPSPPGRAAGPWPELPRPVAGELAAETASLTYVPPSGFSTTVERLQASCNRSGDSLGLLGSSLESPQAARYQVAIAPFQGDGTYRTDTRLSQIGGSLAVTGLFQVFLGPPHESVAEVVANGAVGRLRFSGSGIDARPLEGTLRWECAEVRPLR